MRKLILAISIFCLLSNSLLSQNSEPSLHWFLRPSFGYTFALNPKKFGFITDDLTTITNQTGYWQVFSGGCFINNWGLELNYLINENSQIYKRAERFTEAVIRKYSADYYCDIGGGVFYDPPGSYSGTIQRGSMGPVYRISKGHLQYVFRGLIGVMSFPTDGGSVFLKEKGTNSLLKVEWSANKSTRDIFSLNPSFTFSYKITKRILFDADVNLWLYDLDFNYTETVTNYIKNESVSKLYHYKRMAIDLSAGAGIMIFFK
jgi:hypothetical protein